jgi:hypothetical protein
MVPILSLHRENIRFRHCSARTGAGNKIPKPVVDVLCVSGRSLDVSVKSIFQNAFNHDFSGVRIHTDSGAAVATSVMNTSAYTVGDHVVFGKGQYKPWTPEGMRLLAHELTHVVQQNSPSPFFIENITSNRPDDVFEQEADECARIITTYGVDSYLKLPEIMRINRPVFQGWYINEQVPQELKKTIKGQTHELITNWVLNEPPFQSWFGEKCRKHLLWGVAEPDREKVRLVKEIGNDLAVKETACKYHGWNGTMELYNLHINSFVREAARYIREGRQYNLQFYFGRYLGQALHAIQDVAAHQTKCGSFDPRAPGFQNKCDSMEMDDPNINLEGWKKAFSNTRFILRKFYDQVKDKKESRDLLLS